MFPIGAKANYTENRVLRLAFPEIYGKIPPQ